MSTRNTQPNNAFTLLMSSSSRKRQRASRFVQCPVGCLQHIAEKDINRHIDECLLQQEKNKHATSGKIIDEKLECATPDEYGVFSKEKEPQTPTMNHRNSDEDKVLLEPVAVVSHEKQPNDNTFTSNISNEGAIVNEPTPQPQLPASVSQSQLDGMHYQMSEQPFVENTNKSTEGSSYVDSNQEQILKNSVSIPEEKNAFARMLSQSKVLFSSKEKAAKGQHFHLHANGVITWQAKVTLKDRSVVQDRQQPTEFSITLSSDLPSHHETSETSPPRWVQHHSRLSVPVLKSILQKSIRRRRPLPSVKVAMELADKSLGELLRRLPIIVLEDSTLHPDFDLLVWLMMAHSKDYTIPPSVLVRVFEIIFEICMCPWIDSCPSAISAARDQASDDNAISLTSLHDEFVTEENSDSSSLIWAMLVRAEYGGMKGDVDMLRSFAMVWKHRFNSRDQCSTLGTQWAFVPTIINERAKDQAHQLVSELCQKRLRSLTLKDISLQGIDFHCSSIIDHLLGDDPFRELCFDLLKLNGVSDISHSQLPSMLKRCLWDFSAGVNRRQPLEGGRNEAPTELLNLWNELIAPRVAAFQSAYVEQRLV